VNDITVRLSGTLSVMAVCMFVLLGIIALTLLDIRRRIVDRSEADRKAELAPGEPDVGPW
jgi:nitrate reductase gamma subunit